MTKAIFVCRVGFCNVHGSHKADAAPAALGRSVLVLVHLSGDGFDQYADIDRGPRT